MKNKVVLSIITIMVGVAGCGLFQSYQAHAMPDISGLNLNEADQIGILGATLQIEITVLVDASGKRIAKAEGLGSLVWDGKNALLVTHNHWREILQEKSSVSFYDAQGKLLKSMSGFEFINLMCYLDAGTLVFRSPVEWNGQTQAIIADDSSQISAGDVVLVAQRGGPEGKEATLVEAEIESVTTIRGVPVIGLKGIEGHPVQVGDSGGGVWHDGMLVGNLWYTSMARSTRPVLFSWLKSDEASFESTDESYAALYPAGPLAAMQASPADDDPRGMCEIP